MKCYCCDRRLTADVWEAFLEDDNNASVLVGKDCHARIKATGAIGYVSPKGGPRMFFPKAHAIAYAAKVYPKT